MLMHLNLLKKVDIGKLEILPTSLNSLKRKVDKLDVDKLVPFPVDVSKLSDVVKNDVFANIKDIQIKITDITNLATNTGVNANINEVKTKYLVLLT